MVLHLLIALGGAMGFGESSRMPTSAIWHLSDDLSLVIEIVDCEVEINVFLFVLDGMIGGGLVTLEKARAIRYLGARRPE
jgi:PII-like signaling protein